MEWKNMERGRVERAKKLKLDALVTDSGAEAGECTGSTGVKYRFTLKDCTCEDRLNRHIVCKHMIRLAMECGILNREGRTDEEQHEQDIAQCTEQLARAYGFYYLFGKSVIPNAQYDELKRKLAALEKE